MINPLTTVDARPPTTGLCQVLTKNDNICGMPVVSEQMPYCQFHARVVDERGPHRYGKHLPVDLKETYEEHLEGGNAKDLSGEVAVARMLLSSLLKDLESSRMVSKAIDRIAKSASAATLDVNGDRAFHIQLTMDEYESLLGEADRGKIIMSGEHADTIMKAIASVKGAVESHAKVNPDWVITLADMRDIIGDIIRIVDMAIPREFTDVRRQVVTELKEYAGKRLMSKAMEVAFGAQPKQGSK